MNYDFSLDKKSIGFLTIGTALLGLLVFVAGLIVGANWNANPSETSTTVATTKKTKTRAPVPAAETEEAASQQDEALEDHASNPAAEEAPAQNANPAKPATAPPVAAAPPEAMPPAAGFDKGLQKPTPLTSAEPKVIQRSDAEAVEDAGADEAPVLKRAAFSVQIGLFLEEIDADRLVEELKSLGYRPTIFVGYDSERRPWYSVRIGSYAEQAEAAQAASKFTEKEKMKAVVRPAGSL